MLSQNMEHYCALLCCLVVTGEGGKEADRGISRFQSHLVPALLPVLQCRRGAVLTSLRTRADVNFESAQ